MTNAIIFFIALFSLVLFFGRLLTWVVWKIAPQNCKREFTDKDVLISNVIGITSCLLWTILFYNLTSH